MLFIFLLVLLSPCSNRLVSKGVSRKVSTGHWAGVTKKMYPGPAVTTRRQKWHKGGKDTQDSLNAQLNQMDAYIDRRINHRDWRAIPASQRKSMHKDDDSFLLWLLIGTVVLIVVALIIFAIILTVWWRRKKKKEEELKKKASQRDSLRKPPRKMESEDLNSVKFSTRGPLKMPKEYTGPVKHQLDGEKSAPLEGIEFDQAQNELVTIGSTVDVLEDNKDDGKKPNISKMSSKEKDGVKSADNKSSGQDVKQTESEPYA
ncbi:hypothetical protein Q1695_012670 [Nippostrongylus brasiliensis]|nr:hypothetical protein Q1695_012670 [Nippostrongylus brasiliensis]